MEVVLFNGDKDLVCNYIGINDMVTELTWGGKKGMDVIYLYFPLM
jgi:carboxypeptidase D